MLASQEMTNEKLEMKMLFFYMCQVQKECFLLLICVVWEREMRGFINHTTFVKGYVVTSEGEQSALAMQIFKKAIILYHQPDWS